MDNFFGPSETSQNKDTSNQWISVSDLMTGLMVIFLFVSIALMRYALVERDKAQEARDYAQIEKQKMQIEKDKVKSIAIAYQKNQIAIYDALVKEFENDLKKWNATISKETLSVEFKSPDILFSRGSDVITPQFQVVLNDFFPRYLNILREFKPFIQEIRIEGHTSSQWGSLSDVDQAYFNNMRLSQARTLSVLTYLQNLKSIDQQKKWVREHVAAVGLASSKLMLDKNGLEDSELSRRVSFRVITNADIQIRKIIEE